MESLMQQLNESVSFIRKKTSLGPEVALVLGSGLGNVLKDIKEEEVIEYSAIPHFPLSTVISHQGQLVFGEWNGKKIVAMKGRFHYYEGYSMQQVTFPIRVMKMLGARSIFITNASGGLNPEIKVGDLIVINDHINLVSDHPLRGKNEESLGGRFPDQHNVYDKQLITQALSIARNHRFTCHEGVYVGVAGPTFETPSEYRYMRIIGGDAVGMSTVPEIIVAHHMGMRIFCISVVCDEGSPPVPRKVSHLEVIQAAEQAGPKIGVILKELLSYT